MTDIKHEVVKLLRFRQLYGYYGDQLSIMPYFTQDSEENYVISRQEVKQLHLGSSLGDIFLSFLTKISRNHG